MKTQHRAALCAALFVLALLGGCAKSMTPPGERQGEQVIAQRAATSHRVWRLRWHARNQMLAALTPAHRRLLAQIVATTTTAEVPDVKTSLARLDRELTATEKASVLRIDGALRRALGYKVRRHEQQDPAATLLISVAYAAAIHVSLAIRGTSEATQP